MLRLKGTVVWRILFLFALLTLQPAMADEGLSEEFVEEYKSNLAYITSSESTIGQFEEARDLFAKLPTRDAYEVVSEKLAYYATFPEEIINSNVTMRVGLLTEMFETLGSSHKKDIDILKSLKTWAIVTAQDPGLADQVEVARKKLEGLEPKTWLGLSELSDDKEKLAELNAQVRKMIGISSGNSHKQAIDEAQRFYDFMAERVEGQDKVLKEIQMIFVEDLKVRGQRKAPELLYLIGLPGNGKDTIAENMVDAIWNREGAYRDHMFRMIIKSPQEAWKFFGSATGYVGSSQLPPFLQFLVAHSGGKYMVVQEPDGTSKRNVVHRNPDWHPSQTNLSNGPHRAVLFINEAHNIPMSVKDNVLKEAIEKGIFPVNNPGTQPNAVDTIELPITIIHASNEGISLIEPRNLNGSRIGEPLPYEQLLENWQRVESDPQALKSAIMKTNGQQNDPRTGDGPGISEEYLNRFPDHRIMILKPLSPDTLKAITKAMAEQRSSTMENAKGPFGAMTASLSEELIQFITEYGYVPSENARPIKGRIESFVFRHINEAIMSREIHSTGNKLAISIDIGKNPNGSSNLLFEVYDTETNETYQFQRLILETLNDVPNEPLSNERIRELKAMKLIMNERVFNVEHIIDRLVDSAIVAESASKNKGEASSPATIFAFLGLTSTGKTQTSKEYVQARYGNGSAPVLIDFNGIRSVEAMEAKIIGSYDHRKNPIPSEFMKAYDRATDGNVTFIFDEAANSPRELLKALYEITREPVVRNFVDGKPRPMRNVTIILTGNAGEVIYRKLPTDLPDEIKERAMQEAFRSFVANPGLQHQVLSDIFPEALLARIGSNVFHFGPLTDKAKRQLTQLKLLQGLKTLTPKASERGWDIQLATQADLYRLFDMIEKESYNPDHQGAGIDKFVREQITGKIKALLTSQEVESGQRVLLRVAESIEFEQRNEVNFAHRQLTLATEDGREWTMDVPLGLAKRHSQLSDVDRALVGYHEVGHDVVSEVYRGDYLRPQFLTIIDGVVQMGADFIHYRGLRAGEPTAEIAHTKEAVLREVATLLGGYIAQEITTLGGRSDAGKGNDMARASSTIQTSILQFGLSKRWGKRAVPLGMPLENYVDKQLTEDDRRLLGEIKEDWLTKAERLARIALYANIDRLFIPMSHELVEKGRLDREDIKRLYSEYGVVTEHSSHEFRELAQEISDLIDLIDRGFSVNSEKFKARFRPSTYDFDVAPRAYNFIFRQLSLRNKLARDPWAKLTPHLQMVAASYIGTKIHIRSRDAQFSDPMWMPDRVADLQEFIETERQQASQPVTALKDFGLETLQIKQVRCHQLF